MGHDAVTNSPHRTGRGEAGVPYEQDSQCADGGGDRRPGPAYDCLADWLHHGNGVVKEPGCGPTSDGVAGRSGWARRGTSDGVVDFAGGGRPVDVRSSGLGQLIGRIFEGPRRPCSMRRVLGEDVPGLVARLPVRAGPRGTSAMSPSSPGADEEIAQPAARDTAERGSRAAREGLGCSGLGPRPKISPGDPWCRRRRGAGSAGSPSPALAERRSEQRRGDGRPCPTPAPRSALGQDIEQTLDASFFDRGATRWPFLCVSSTVPHTALGRSKRLDLLWTVC